MGAEALFVGLQTPWVFNRSAVADLGREGYERLSFPDLERVKLKKIIEVLDHPELGKLIDEHRVTLALIKPQADLNIKGYDDLSAAASIEGEIRSPLHPIFNISIRLSKGDAETFYANQKKTLEKLSAIKKTDLGNRWKELIDYMSSGPTTFILLFSDKRDAISEWRKQIGHWDVSGRRDYKTIRGRWAKNNYTSIVHGSDSPETAKREIEVLRNHLVRLGF